MARLTRTQKYADLREQISHDREESLETQELNKYQEKLNDVKSQFGSAAEPVFRNEPVVNKPVELKETISDKVAETEKESMKSLDDILSDMMSETFDVPPVQPIEDIIPSVKEEVVTPVMQEPVVEAPISQIETPVAPTPVETHNNDFINKTLDEVNGYNKQTGKTTLEDLPNTLINDIRHNQKPAEQAPEISDDDFSNTVSLEIEKVLNEIKNQKMNEQQEVKPVVINEAELVDDIKEAPVQPTPVQEQVQQPVIEPVKEEVKQETFEHPVLTKTLEQPVVEIKNISETMNLSKTTEDVVDDTIPFDADKVQEQVDDEYEEDEAPSKVLNVILGILIFVLVVVLGIIVYYILVAKGIIG